MNKNAVIFIPGVLGSELYYNDEEQRKTKIWPLGWNDFLNIVKYNKLRLGGESYRKLLDLIKCDKNGAPNVNIMPGRVIDSFYRFFDVYKNFLENLTKDGFDIYNFPYDWRLDVAVHGQGLRELVDEATSKQYEKVSLVAHSLGALLARNYLKNNNPNLDNILFVSPVNHGTPLAYAVLKTGRGGLYQYSVLNSFVKELIVNFPSIYQMCPSETYFQKHRQKFKEDWITIENEITELTPEKIYITGDESKLENITLARRAIDFHRSIPSSLNNATNIVCTGIDTLCSVNITAKQVITNHCPIGDGTVTTIGSMLDNAQNIIIDAKTHTSIMGTKRLLHYITND